MSRYVASRLVWKHLIFPQAVTIEEYHVRTWKRRFPLFWIVNEQSISLSKVASIKLHKGLFFSDIVIENSGGDYPIKVEGLTNARARMFREELEKKERKMVQQSMADTPADKWAPDPHNEDGDDTPVALGNGVKVHGLYKD